MVRSAQSRRDQRQFSSLTTIATTRRAIPYHVATAVTLAAAAALTSLAPLCAFAVGANTIVRLLVVVG